jgi:hypothetical protein
MKDTGYDFIPANRLLATEAQIHPSRHTFGHAGRRHLKSTYSYSWGENMQNRQNHEFDFVTYKIYSVYEKLRSHNLRIFRYAV